MRLLTPILFCIVFAACTPKINCKNPYIDHILLLRSDTTQPVTDTSVTLYKFRKNSNLSQPLDSVHYGINPANQVLFFYGGSSGGEVDFVGYDWELVCSPTGRQYVIKEAQFDGRREYSQYDGYECYNKVSFLCNGVRKTVDPVQQYASIYLAY